MRYSQPIGAALLAFLLAACSPQVTLPQRPTEAPVQERLPTATPTTAPPTPTPVALGAATALPTLTSVPAAETTAAPTAAAPPTAAAAPALYVAPTSNCLAGQGGTPRLPGRRGGVNIALGSQNDRAFALAREMNAEWVRVKLRWSDMEPQPGAYNWASLDQVVTLAQQNNLHLLVALGTAPAWATADGAGGVPGDPATFGAFVKALAAHANGQVLAYEIWPGANTAAANGGRDVIEPGRYVDLLVAAHGGIKAVQPCALVLAGAMVPSAARTDTTISDDLDYYRQMIGYRGGIVRQAYDIMAVQSFTGGLPGKGDWPRAQPNLSRNYYAHAETVRDEMVLVDEGDKQIWVVDVGYHSTGDTGIRPKLQADYWETLIDVTDRYYGWMSGLFAQGIALGDAATGDVADMNLVEPDGTPRPPYASLQQLFAKQRADATRDLPIKGTDLSLVWDQQFGKRQTAPMILGQDGVLYSPGTNGAVRGADPNGAWRRNTIVTKKIMSGIAVDARGTLFYATDYSEFGAVTAGGVYQWSIQTDSKPITPPVLAPDGSQVYLGVERERLVAYNPADGSKRWETLLGSPPAPPAVGADGTVYVSAADGSFRAIAPDGTVRWSLALGSWAIVPPVPTADGVVIALDIGSVIRFDSNGQQRWRTELSTNPAGMAVGNDGSVYVTAGDKSLRALNPNGQQLWQVPIDSRPTAPAVGPDGRVFVGAEDGKFRVVQPDSTVAGIFDFDDPVTVAPVVGRDGVVYVSAGGRDVTVLAFGPTALRDTYRVP